MYRSKARCGRDLEPVPVARSVGANSISATTSEIGRCCQGLFLVLPRGNNSKFQQAPAPQLIFLNNFHGTTPKSNAHVFVISVAENGKGICNHDASSGLFKRPAQYHINMRVDQNALCPYFLPCIGQTKTAICRIKEWGNNQMPRHLRIVSRNSPDSMPRCQNGNRHAPPRRSTLFMIKLNDFRKITGFRHNDFGWLKRASRLSCPTMVLINWRTKSRWAHDGYLQRLGCIDSSHDRLANQLL